MAMTVQCDIVSADKSIFSGLVEMVIAAGDSGDLGVMYGHAPLLTSIIPGPVRVIKQGGEEEVFYVSGGYIEVQPGVVTILADSALRADDIDEAAAKQAQEDVQKEMNNHNADFDYSNAAVQLAQAAAQIRAVQQLKKKYGK